MSFDLKTLFEFQNVLVDMQKLLVEARMKNPQADYSATEKRIDKLIEICNHYDGLYFSAYYNGQKISQLQSEIIIMGQQIESLKAENEKLLKSLEWNQA